MNEQRGHPIEDPKVSRQASFAKPLTESTIVRLAGVSGGHSAAFAHLFAHLSDLVTGCTPPITVKSVDLKQAGACRKRPVT